MNAQPKRTNAKASIADLLMWSALLIVFLSSFLPLFFIGLLPLFLYPAAFFWGLVELHKSRQIDHPLWHHYLLSPIFSSIIGVVHVLLLLSDKVSQWDVLLPLLLSAMVLWAVASGISLWFWHSKQKK